MDMRVLFMRISLNYLRIGHNCCLIFIRRQSLHPLRSYYVLDVRNQWLQVRKKNPGYLILFFERRLPNFDSRYRWNIGTRRKISKPSYLKEASQAPSYFSVFVRAMPYRLYLAGAYASFSSNDVHIVVGKFVSPVPDHFFDLLPVPCDLIPVQ